MKRHEGFATDALDIVVDVSKVPAEAQDRARKIAAIRRVLEEDDAAFMIRNPKGEPVGMVHCSSTAQLGSSLPLDSDHLDRDFPNGNIVLAIPEPDELKDILQWEKLRLSAALEPPFGIAKKEPPILDW